MAQALQASLFAPSEVRAIIFGAEVLGCVVRGTSTLQTSTEAPICVGLCVGYRGSPSPAERGTSDKGDGATTPPQEGCTVRRVHLT